jgi:hypothetical protein
MTTMDTHILRPRPGTVRIFRIFRAIGLITAFLCVPAAARAQGAMTNGAIHTAAISAAGELDQWTFSANQGDAITIAIGETGADTAFYPWMRLQAPNGTQIANTWGDVAAQLSLYAPQSGTYTLIVASNDSGFVPSPATTWYLAEGSTSGDFALFYLLQNPNETATTATVRYLLPGGAPPIVREYQLAGRSRTTIPVDDQGAELAGTDVSAVISAPLPIIVERAMYRSTSSQVFAAGHGSTGVTAGHHRLSALGWRHAHQELRGAGQRPLHGVGRRRADSGGIGTAAAR